MNINDLTLGQAIELAALFGGQSPSLNGMIGQRVIIRTYSAGVWFGVLSKKSGNEVILTQARRMWRWWAADGISLSAVAIYGVKADKSKICGPVPSVWLEAIEIMTCSVIAAEQLAGIEHAKAE